MTKVLLQGTLDTKEEDCEWLISRLNQLNIETVTVDVGSFSQSSLADITSDEVIRAAGEDPDALRSRKDRGEMLEVLGRGAAEITKQLIQEEEVHGFLSFGGSGGSSVAAPVMQVFPVGFPKLLVSTMASGDISPYVGGVDATLMYSVVDVAGINSISQKVLGNAASAIAGMAKNFEETRHQTPSKPVVAISMFGLTTPAAREAKEHLTGLGYEVQIFHATGAGGKSMEKLIESDLVAGVLDLTTTELADDLVGGVLTAGPRRLEMAGKKGIPQVVSMGALDMINFGPEETVPPKFEGRNFVVHNASVTLMRTNMEENAELGRRIGSKLAAVTGPTRVFIPLRGFSGIDAKGKQFWDPEADARAISELKEALGDSSVPVIEKDCNINDEGFGLALAEELHTLISNK